MPAFSIELLVSDVNRATRDKLKHRTALDRKGFAWIMSENKYGHVVGWVVTPPARPILVWPFSTNWAEHIQAHCEFPVFNQVT